MHPEFNVVGCSRSGALGDLQFDVRLHSIEALLETTHYDWVINAIGVLSCHVDEDDPGSVAAAVQVNSTFPNQLAAAAGTGTRVIHMTTDGVFSGRNGPYDEEARHDDTGVYGRSKSLGEPRSENCISLRCSVIGPEKHPARSLLGRLVSQPPGAVMTGYTNHRWNGITTLHMAKLCTALIRNGDVRLPRVLHVVPGDALTKAELIALCALAFGRNDLVIDPQPAWEPVDRTLQTRYPEINQQLWNAAGYTVPPSISEMVRELSAAYRH
jgi:dTDP-4-dehydrorhamnose reductase